MAGKFKFNSSKHPRGAGGKFIHTPDAPKAAKRIKGSKVSKNPKLAKLDGLDVKQRMRLLNTLSKRRDAVAQEPKNTQPKVTKPKAAKVTKPTIPTADELGKLKVKELEELAAKLGAEIPLKYKNRKVSWVESIEKLRDKGTQKKPPKETKPKAVKETKPKVTKETKTKTPKGSKSSKDKAPIDTSKVDRATLSKQKLDKLKELAKEAGATPPEKLTHRKEPWINAILAKKEADANPPVTVVPPKTEPIKEIKRKPEITPPPPKKELDKPSTTPKLLEIKPTSGTSVTHQELLDVGKHYADKAGLKPLKGVDEYRAIQKEYNDAKLINNKLIDKGQYGTKEQYAAEALENKLAIKHDKALDKLNAERDAMADVHRNIVTDIVKSHNLSADAVLKQTSKVRIDLPDAKDVEQTEKMLRKFVMMSGEKLDTLKTIIRDKPRGYANNATGVVNIGEGLRSKTVFHEIAHHMEFSRPELRDAAISWRNSRADGKSYVDPKNGEEYIPDKFEDRYVGRVYRYNDGKEAQVTEVVSRGAEHFVNNKAMQELFEKDPEHYYLMVGMFLHQ